MEDINARPEKLLTDAEDCELIAKFATDLDKRALFTKLSTDLRSMANDLRAAISARGTGIQPGKPSVTEKELRKIEE